MNISKLGIYQNLSAESQLTYEIFHYQQHLLLVHTQNILVTTAYCERLKFFPF